MEFQLPKMLKSIVDGEVSWQRLGPIQYDELGFFLSCHLIIEHYLDCFIELQGFGDLNWSEVRLTFNQKVALLQKHRAFDVYDPIPSLKHFNSLRNKLAHNIAHPITMKDVEPLRAFLANNDLDSEMELDTTVKIVDQYMYMVCCFFAGAITRGAREIQSRNT